MYLQASENALRSYEEMAKEFSFDFEKKPAYTYSRVSKKQIEDAVIKIIENWHRQQMKKRQMER